MDGTKAHKSTDLRVSNLLTYFNDMDFSILRNAYKNNEMLKRRLTEEAPDLKVKLGIMEALRNSDDSRWDKLGGKNISYMVGINFKTLSYLNTAATCIAEYWVDEGNKRSDAMKFREKIQDEYDQVLKRHKGIDIRTKEEWREEAGDQYLDVMEAINSVIMEPSVGEEPEIMMGVDKKDIVIED